MLAVRIYEYGDASVLRLEKDVPIEQPNDNEVQVQVDVCGMNPVDHKICAGRLATRMPNCFPIIPGWDASGTVRAVGKNITHFKVGDQVYGYFRKPTIQHGTYAEFVTCDENAITLRPRNLSSAQAAVISLSALTAFQALDGVLSKGQTILIQAGAGGVGNFAIQLAKAAGATVITTASAINHDYVKRFGADTVIDYITGDPIEQIKQIAPEGIDVVFDSIGGATFRKSAGLLKKNGRAISIIENLNPSDKASFEGEFGVKHSYTFVKPDGEQLKKITAMLEEGKLLCPDVKVFPISDVVQAFNELKTGHVRGKLALQMPVR